MLAAVLVIPTAATITDVADHPIAAQDGPTFVATPPLPSGGQDPVLPEVPTSADAVRPATMRVVAQRGESIWAVAERTAVAPGVLLRHNRRSGSDHPRAAAAADALAAGQPLERAEPLVAPAPRVVASSKSRESHPVASTPDLAALEPAFDRWADHFGVPRDLLKALAWVESGWDNDSRSASGGLGIGRLQPLRAQYLADHVAKMSLDPAIAVDNIALTAAQLRVLLDETPDVESAVAAHRQGITDTRLTGVDPSLDGYVDAVLTVRRRFT